ncbi:MAG: DUF47 domain-containing protein [Candidatus Altiarchaeota archaeon]|nr:DUF47 domain-containing protein [Candidatus Altiarchaeota archaeon]
MFKKHILILSFTCPKHNGGMKMTLFNLISVLAGEQEKETIRLINEHADMTYKVVYEFKNAFDAFEEGNYKELGKQVENTCNLESMADDLRRKIEENMYSGAFLPGSRSLILNFVEMVDEIADAAQDAAKMLVFLEGRKMPKNILPLIKMEIDAGLDTIDVLRRSVIDMANIADMRSAIERIRSKEHEADEIENKAYSLLYKKVEDGILALLLSKLVEYSGNISDRAEDATDALSLILLLHKA